MRRCSFGQVRNSQTLPVFYIVIGLRALHHLGYVIASVHAMSD